ncbi:Spc97/Spc98 family protein [Xylariomycetidae sp. FL2044]|nr:Spc97/Spc98 family protein [Xylariomycetidae sp. FL2044]
MADGDPANVFAFPDFEQSSQWLNPSTQSDDSFFRIDLEGTTRQQTKDLYDILTTPAQDHHESSQLGQHEFFQLPSSLTPENLNGSTLDKHHAFSPSEPLHDVELRDLDVFDDGWFQTGETPAATAEFKTWDAFTLPGVPEAAPLFITEAGPRAFDAAIKSDEDVLRIGNTDCDVVQSNPYLAALLAAVLGRGSVFFVWNGSKNHFVPELDKMRISGYSTKVLQGIQNRCLESGTITRSLSTFVQNTYKTHPSPIRIALAKSIDIILLVIQRKLGESVRRIKSLLQLQHLVAPIRTVLVYFKSLITASLKTTTDEQLLSLVFHETQRLENGNVLLADVMREVLISVSEPWTDFVEKWIGVKAEEGIRMTKDGPGKNFVKVENVATIDDLGFEAEEPDYVLDGECMPNFVPSEIAVMMFETGRNLRLLRAHHPEHSLSQRHIISSSRPPTFRWQFSWDSIRQAQSQAERYERQLSQSLHDKRFGTATLDARTNIEGGTNQDVLQFFGQDGHQLEGRLLASIDAMNKPPSTAMEKDSLSALLEARLFNDSLPSENPITQFTPHWSLIPLHSFGPLVAAQARIINREYMKLLFEAHNLRDHLRVQRQFHLLGNGVFCSRLSHALFDPELETAERQAGVARQGGVMGLRLSGRDNWPPASSELRLALMGILGESYRSSAAQDIPDSESRQLPGDISFAVRDLSSEEIDKCLDPGSLEALDFLRLSYKTPAPLAPVISPVVLMKYDRIFKLLLRILRMLFVIGQLCRDAVMIRMHWHDMDDLTLRFRFEAQHFVTSISTYFFDTGIEMPWRRFEAWLDDIQSKLTKQDTHTVKAKAPSPDQMREAHEATLDSIMHTLLLRKRQQPVMKLLEDIFNLILMFSNRTRLAASGKVDSDAGGEYVRGLYDGFRKKVDVFITVCRGLREKGGNTSKATRHDLLSDDGKQFGDKKEESTIDRLLVKLEMSAYYARSKT